MEYPELSIAITTFNTNPMLSLRGIMDGWHATALEEALQSFYGQGTNLTVDLSDLKFTGIEGASSMLRAFRIMRPEMKVYIVASGHISSLLKKAELGSHIRICESLDEVAEIARPEPEYTTSRWIAYSNDIELPLAA